jgi:hypothetical protein
MENYLLKFRCWTWRILHTNKQNGNDARQTQNELYSRWKEGCELLFVLQCLPCRGIGAWLS